MNILIISSLSPYRSSNLGWDYMEALRGAGHHVDFLTKYKFKNMTDGMYSVFETEPPTSQSVVRSNAKLKDFFKSHFLRFTIYLKSFRSTPVIVYPDEDEPGIDTEMLLSQITNIGVEYDLIMMLFWDGMITSKTIRDVYDKYKIPILLLPVDMAVMTGGCYYFGKCRGYKNECRNCPSAKQFKCKDQAHHNFLFKQHILHSVNCVITTNEWNRKSLQDSHIVQYEKLHYGTVIVNEKLFKPVDKMEVRAKLGLPENKFIMFFGAKVIDSPRKGISYLIKALNRLANEDFGKDLLFVLAGDVSERIVSMFNIDVKLTGFLSPEELAMTYAASDLYLSPSIDDSGPSMVNQSLMCGTPVIAFNVGVANELIDNGRNGYIAQARDSKSFADGIIMMHTRMLTNETEIRHCCRETAMRHNSYKAFSERFMSYYQFLKRN